MTKVDWTIRILTALVVVGLGLVAAVVSFQHGLQVVQAHGQSGRTAYLTPLTVDGLVLVASLVLLDSARHGVKTPGLAVWTMALGIGATLGVNVLFGWSYGIVGAIVAGWPAVALVLTVELLMGMIRRGQAVSQEGAQIVRPPVEVAEGTRIADTPVEKGQQIALTPGGKVSVGNHDGIPEVDGVEVRVPEVHPDPDPHQVRAAVVFAEEIEAGEVPSVRRIKSTLRVGQPRAEQVRAYLAILAAG